jgi:hypothetical protein
MSDAAREIMVLTKNDGEPTSLTLVGHSTDSPEPLLRLSPATGHDAEMLDVEDPDLGYDAETFPYQQLQRKIRSTSRTGPLGGLHGTISIYSIVGRLFDNECQVVS